MITLTNRPCRIGPSINARTEKHGDDDVQAFDIPLAGLMLEKEELNAFLGDPYAYDALFNHHRSNGKADEPIFKKFRPLVLRDKFEEGEVVFTVGMGSEEIRLKGVKLAKVTLDPQVGGLTLLSVQVQCTPSTETIAKVLPYMNHEIEAEVTFGKKIAKSEKQRELPINGFGEGEQPEQGEGKPKSRGRRKNGHDGEQASLQ